MEKREQIKKWFTINLSLKFIGILLIFMAIIFVLGADSSKLLQALILGLMFVSGGIFCILSGKSDLNEIQLDQWLEEDLAEITKNRPYDKLGILKEDEIAESLLVVGPVFWNVPGFDEKDILKKKGKDGFNRYTIWSVQVFIFTENYLSSYKCLYNWLKNTYINESTNEFFYKDVVSVKTDTISSAYTLKDGQRMLHSEAFQLKLSGDEITVITNDANLNTSTTMTSRAEKAVQSIRVILRDKKR